MMEELKQILKFAPMFLLLFAVIVSALGMVHVRHEYRIAYSERWKKEILKNNLRFEEKQLSAEYATWTTQTSISKKATEHWDMFAPRSEHIFSVSIGGQNGQ